MEKFSEFLVETKMEGSIGTERKGLRHVKNYILPYLSKTERKHAVRNFSQYISPGDIEDKHGEKHNTDTKATTHILSGDVNGHKIGTPVRVIGVRHDPDGKIHVQTASHGEVPLSKLHKPEELKKPVITQGGFDIEAKIAKNLGTAAAGSTGTAYDYHYRGPEGGLVGKARKIEEDKPILRGESKQNKAKMGESAVKYDKDSKTWSFTHQKLGKVFSKATHPKSGLPILEHLNKYHKNGVVTNGFSIPAPRGMARSYLNNLGVNSLHLHRTEKAGVKKQAIDHGTTFTIGDTNEHKGKSNLGHLSNKELDALDGSLRIEVGGPGALKLSHLPKPTVFKEYASRSVTDPNNHADLTREEHANLFRQHIDRHLGVSKQPTQTSTETSKPVAKSFSKFVSKPKPKLGQTPIEQTPSPIQQKPNPGIQDHRQHVDHTVGGWHFKREQQ